MSRTPEDFIEQVVDRATFVEFLEILSEDWCEEEEIEKAKPSPSYSAGALGWENGSIGTFLDAAAAFGKSDIANAIPQHSNPWRAAAQIILAGKWYE
jgi:hypothetical protein